MAHLKNGLSTVRSLSRGTASALMNITHWGDSLEDGVINCKVTIIVRLLLFIKAGYCTPGRRGSPQEEIVHCEVTIEAFLLLSLSTRPDITHQRDMAHLKKTLSNVGHYLELLHILCIHV